MQKTRNQSGQVLLIAVMLMAVLMTVVFSASFVSRTDTQISKLEEENQKALAAAEAGIEAALKSGTIADLRTLDIPSGFTGSATISTASSTAFTTPLIKKDSQYSFYLSTPAGSIDNPDFGTLTSSYNNPLTLCSSSNSFAMSVAFLKSNGTFKRFAINPPPPSPTIITGTDVKTGSSNVSDCPAGQTFTYKYQLTSTDVGANNLLLFVRLVGNGAGAKVGIMSGSGNLPLQGRTIVSEAKSSTGVTKKIQLFQSYPQIPSEFFVTSF